MSSVCYMCRGDGIEGGCPKCGKEFIPDAVVRHATSDITKKDLVNLNIPLYYKTNRWSKSKLQRHNMDLFETPMFDNFAAQLDKCHRMCEEGSLPSGSGLIIAPPGFSKTTWAHSCIVNAHEHGYNVVPLIDTTQLKRILYTSSENPSWYVNYMDYSVDKYVNADLLIVSIAKGPEFCYAFEVIINILDVRSRMNKPTIFISDYTVNELCVQDTRKYLKNLITRFSQGDVDPYRYPFVVEFNDLLGGVK